MNNVLEIENRRTAEGLGDFSSFISLPSKASREISEDAQDVFKRIGSVRTNLVLTAVEAQSGEEFQEIRKKIFGDVVRTNKAMGELARVMIPPSTLDRLTWQSLAELEAELTESGTKKFGENAKEQAIFTVWTLRKINRLLAKVLERHHLEGALREKDQEIASEFSFFLYWTYFHLECISSSMRFDKPIHMDVLEEICDGLRAVVNAYGLLRRGYDLRYPSIEDEPLDSPIWNEEDDELLASSMEDMESMDIEEY